MARATVGHPATVGRPRDGRAALLKTVDCIRSEWCGGYDTRDDDWEPHFARQLLRDVTLEPVRSTAEMAGVVRSSRDGGPSTDAAVVADFATTDSQGSHSHHAFTTCSPTVLRFR